MFNIRGLFLKYIITNNQVMKILSLYTYLFKDNSNYYLYNSENDLKAQISESLYNDLNSGAFNKISKQLVNTLESKNVLIDSTEKYSYYNKMKIRNNTLNYNNETIILAIVPNLGCNFSCPYCFEGDKKAKSISEKVINNLISFLNSHTRAKNLAITWYGGEPLLSFNKIEELFNRILTETKLNIISHSIVTNGYLITPQVIDFFNKSKLNEIQITLDGNENNHNLTRFIKGSHKPTFDVIVKNIGSVLEKMPNTDVHVRINISKNNQDDFIEMYNYLNERFQSKRLTVYPGIIKEKTCDGRKLCSHCFTNSNLFQFYEGLWSKGCNIKFFNNDPKMGCVMNYLDSYIIGPSGEFYKCWEDVNNSSKIIGYINEENISNQALFGQYMNDSNKFENEKCRNCKCFPICGGGCGAYRLRNKYKEGQFDICSPLKDEDNLKRAILHTLSSINIKNTNGRVYNEIQM